MAGASLLLWLGEQVTQKGVGNGISLVIFAGIMLSLPNQVRLVYAQIHTGNVPWFNLVLLLAAFLRYGNGGCLRHAGDPAHSHSAHKARDWNAADADRKRRTCPLK